MVKVILISQIQLPFDKIGSWTTLYKNYLAKSSLIDYLVCKKPLNEFPSVKYSFVDSTWFSKIKKKIKRNPYLDYFEALFKIINSNQKFVIQVVDNFGIIKPLQQELVKKGLRENCYIQFFYHGYSPFCKNIEQSWFFEYIDEMILLTYLSYEEHKKYYTVLPTRFSVLHNGIDTHKFRTVSPVEKVALKERFNVYAKTVFVWCSQDRPKKGLHIVLDAWQQVHQQQPNTVLWVIGCEPKTPQEGVEYLGKIPNDELPKYFQISDCYLFPTLCHEGFGMSLIEALHCGNYCIASSIGGVPEVLQYGKLGKLIDTPHFVSSWEDAMITYLDNRPEASTLPSELYSAEAWALGMNTIINNAERYFL
ncbi:glycosyltransferase family 4 protein [Flavobacterium sp. TMP13]|uniref:glycosyltransferase family 4 protein n=1 Tax=Flavobacterium sp. TMP13 TaxID=3425950 RepID=UPI003D7756DE